MQKSNFKTIKSSLTDDDFEKFWLLFFFNLKENEGFIIGAIKRAYRDFNRTIEKMPRNEEERKILRKKWIDELEFNIKQLLDKDFLNQNEFDDWHHDFCLKLAQINKDLILTVGQTQKWINMSLKYLFLMGERNIQGITKNYHFFHIPIDGIIQKEMQDKFGIEKFLVPWSKISDYDDYLNYQKEARRSFVDKIPMDEEFKLFNEAFNIFT